MEANPIKDGSEEERTSKMVPKIRAFKVLVSKLR